MEIFSKYCIGCGYCYLICKNEAVFRDINMLMKISSEHCNDCRTCQLYCPTGAIFSTGGKK